MRVNVGFPLSSQPSCDSLVVELSVAIAQTRVQFPVTAFLSPMLPLTIQRDSLHLLLAFLLSLSETSPELPPPVRSPKQVAALYIVLMSKELHSSGAISISGEEQVPAAACHNWEGISEASSIIMEDEHWQAVEQRVLAWFQSRGVFMADPQEMLQAAEDRFKRSLSMRNSNTLGFTPSLSKRRKMLSHLHINLDPPPSLPAPPTQGMAESY